MSRKKTEVKKSVKKSTVKKATKKVEVKKAADKVKYKKSLINEQYINYGGELWKFNKKLSDAGTTYDEQMKNIEEYCKSNNITVEQYIKRFEDKGINRIKVTELTSDKERELQLRIWALRIYLLKEQKVKDKLEGLI